MEEGQESSLLDGPAREGGRPLVPRGAAGVYSFSLDFIKEGLVGVAVGVGVSWGRGEGRRSVVMV